MSLVIFEVFCCYYSGDLLYGRRLKRYKCTILTTEQWNVTDCNQSINQSIKQSINQSINHLYLYTTKKPTACGVMYDIKKVQGL